MILLLTRENSTYDSGTKTFWFALDKQLDSKVKHVRIQTFSFKPSTAAVYPHGVLACSSTLTDMALRTHVNVLKDANHRSDTDVLCCLHQEQGVLYKLAAPLLLTLDRRGFVNKIDIYFTDMAGNRLEGDYVPVSTAGPQLSDMETMFDSGSGNLKFFMDCDLSSSYRKQDDSEASQGDTVKQWVAPLRTNLSHLAAGHQGSGGKGERRIRSPYIGSSENILNR